VTRHLRQRTRIDPPDGPGTAADAPGATGALARLLLGHFRRYRAARLQDLAATTLRDGSGIRGWVVPVVNLTLRSRRWLTRALIIEPRWIASRVAFAGRGGAARRRDQRHHLSLLCPTRSRVRELTTLLRSVQRTAHAGGRIEVLCYVDADDPQLPAYRRLFERAGRRFPGIGRCVLKVGDPVGVPAAWNVLAAAATGDYLLMANDDQLYVDHGWDAALDRRVAELTAAHPDEVLCLYFDGGQYPAGGCDFPIISRVWYETLGYYAPEIFQQWQAERWIFEIARRIDRLFPVPGVLVEHLHYQDFKAPFDATYQRHRMTREKASADELLFRRTAQEREAAADSLRSVIQARAGRPRADGARPAPVTAAGQSFNGSTVMTTEATVSAAQDGGTRRYIMQMARRYYGSLIDAWHYGGHGENARACAELAVQQGVWAHPAQRPREYIPELFAKPVHDPADFWFAAYLEEHYPQIRAEVEQVLDAPLDPVLPTVEDAALIRHGAWKQAHLFRDGRWQEDVCARFPVTRGILAEIPEVTTFSPGVITVSRVDPGSHIMPHCGPTNALLRVHFPLTIPPGVSIRVADQVMTWEEGKCLVFDDSFEHEVRHDGTTDRVVLILDTLHPDLGGDHRERLLQRRLATEEQIIGFMREGGFERIGTEDGEIVIHPEPALRDLVRRYMAATGIDGAELRDDDVVWYRSADRA